MAIEGGHLRARPGVEQLCVILKVAKGRRLHEGEHYHDDTVIENALPSTLAGRCSTTATTTS
jgi:hypothetical protein